MKFHEIVVPIALSSSAKAANPHLEPLMKELIETRKQKARIYQTYVIDGAKRYTFVTTSKDMHLGFGSISLDGQRHLARLLAPEFSRGKFGQLLIRFEKDEGDAKSTVLVATSTHSGETSFGFSPAH